MHEPVRSLGGRLFQGMLPEAVAVCVAYWLLWPFLFAGHFLPFEAYSQPVLILEALTRPRFLVIFVLLPLPLVFLWKRIRWEDLDPHGRTRILVLVAAGVLVWSSVTWNRNQFFDHAYALDRLLLVLCCGLIWRHPLFVVPTLAVLTPYIQQLSYPLPAGDWHWPDKQLPYAILVLFATNLFVQAIAGRRRRQLFLLLALGFTGCQYGYAAISKLMLTPPTGWLLDDPLSHLLVSAYQQGGWLRVLGDEGIVALAGALSYVERPLVILTFLIEAAGFFLLLRGRLSQWILASLVLMHGGIVATSGIFFWKWMAWDAALLLVLRSELAAEAEEAPPEPLFARKHQLFGAGFMLLATLFLPWIPFDWYDTRLTQYFTVRGIGVSGAEYPLDARCFAPYDIVFNQSRFYYLTRRPVVGGTYGTVRSHRLMQELEAAAPADVPAIRRRHGVVQFHPQLAAIFERFLVQSLANAQAAGSLSSWQQWVAPPFHFQTMRDSRVYRLQEPLTRLEVHFEERFFTGERIVEVTDEVVRRIPLGGARQDAPR